MSGILRLGDQTRWGRVGAVGFICGERYYFMVSKTDVVSMIPAIIVEAPKAKRGRGETA